MGDESARTASSEPVEVYRDRLTGHGSDAARWAVLDGRLSNLRLAIFLAGIAVGWFAFGSKLIAGGWLALVAVVFVALLIGHDRVIQWRGRAERAVAFYERGLARIEDRWVGTGEAGEGFRDAGHPYADDMDVFGPGSLFELISLARTPAGEATLAGWLRTPSDVATIRARQHAVEELRSDLELREDLALLGEELRSRLDPEALVQWGALPSQLTSTALRIAAAGLSAVTAAALAGWFIVGFGPIPFAAMALVQLAFAAALRKRVSPVIAAAGGATRDLDLLRDVLARIEASAFEAPRLRALRSALDVDGLPPSRRIAQIDRLSDLLDARRNQFFAPIALLFMWGTQLALAIEHWRAACGPHLREWVDAAGEIEALCSLAGYAYEHPADPFPEIVEGEAAFEASGLGHPLLPESGCVRNDLSLGGERRALMISGSNMSGKSTLLRSVGSNVVLALAGAPVRAHRLRLSPLAIGASLRVIDSLQDGTSHFYAEIKRLRLVVDLTGGPLPVLFLLDEILHGTNSHDRRIGADAVVRGLLDRGAIGLVTTHDLALARIADEQAPRIENVHFEDHLEEGRMSFDYRLRPGIVDKSNALELMRSVGLEV